MRWCCEDEPRHQIYQNLIKLLSSLITIIVIFSVLGCPIRISQPSAQRTVVNNRLSVPVTAVGVLRERAPVPQDPCVPSPCGAQAQCRSTGNRAVGWGYWFEIGKIIEILARYAAVLLVTREIPTLAAPRTLATLHPAEKMESVRETVRAQQWTKFWPQTLIQCILFFLFPPSLLFDDGRSVCSLCMLPPVGGVTLNAVIIDARVSTSNDFIRPSKKRL